MEKKNLPLIESKIRKVIEDTIEKDITNLDLNDNVIQKMGLDSMTALEIMAALEMCFKIRIQERDLPKITSLKSIIEIIEAHLKKQASLAV